MTGSGRNIGRAIALELASRGFNIVVNGSSDEKACEKVVSEIKASGVEAVVAMGDVGVRANVDSIVNTGLDAFGSVDVLVNNAAIRPSFDILNDSDDDWQRVMDVNFNSAFWLTRACLPKMLEKGWGRLIYFTGMNAQQGYPGKSAVSVTKHASWGLTKSMAKDFGPRGITSNIISPGTIVGDDENASSDTYKSLLEKNPGGRLGTPSDIATYVGYLSGDDAGFVNGQLLQINGGVVG